MRRSGTGISASFAPAIMTERELIKKLNNLHRITPDKEWKKTNREILCTQISNSASAYLPTTWEKFWIPFRNTASVAFQPVVALTAFVIVVFSSFLASNLFFKFKPGDSLYIARVLGEKTRLNVTFDEAEKNRLEIQFAKDHARDIASLLSDPQFADNGDNQKEVDKLNNDLKNEIVRLRTLTPTVAQNTSEDDKVFSAETGKEVGFQIYNPDPSAQPVNLADPTYQAPIVASSSEVIATSTKVMEPSLEDLVNDKNYKEVVNKLETIK